MSRHGMSESKAWDVIHFQADSALKEASRLGFHPHDKLVRHLTTILVRSSEMLDQVERGVHVNPPLVIYANPRSSKSERLKSVGVMSHEIHSLAYRHAEDGEPYKHDFENPTDLIACETADGQRVLLIRNPQGLPVWDNF